MLLAVAGFCQEFPSTSGTCQIDVSGVRACNLMGPGPSATDPAHRTKLSVMRFVLGPGASFDGTVTGIDGIVVAETNANLVNEADVSRPTFHLYAGGVALLLGDTPYRIRNAGNERPSLLLISVRKELQSVGTVSPANSSSSTARWWKVTTRLASVAGRRR